MSAGLSAQIDPRRHPLATTPIINRPKGNIPNTPLAASTISFLLGSIFAPSLLLTLFGGFPGSWWATYQLSFFLAAWSAFHWGEFAVTAGWNFEKCSIDSFLLDNGTMYHIANGIAVTEYLISNYFEAWWKTLPYVSTFGILLVIIGQTLRSLAMIHASTNFSHLVQYQKRQNHRLVTDGIYTWFRHPSYAGFFYWALGTQLVLQNPISFIMFTVILWRFFYDRIQGEEAALVRFFGDDYRQFKQRVGTRIPFIP